MSRFAKVMIALLAVAVFATPALAEYKFNVYGSARVHTFYSDWDGEESFDINQATNSRFGMRASNGDVSGHYEIASTGGLRLLYGQYKFNGGHFMFGQNYGAFGLAFLNNSVYGGDNNGIGYGALYESRRVFVKVGLDSGFALWLSQNLQQGDSDSAELPKLAVSYTGKADIFSYHAAVGYQSNELVDDSFLVGFAGKIDLNPAFVAFTLGYGENVREYGIVEAAGIGGSLLAATAADEVEYLSATLEAGFKANAMNTIVAGATYVQEEHGSVDAKRMSLYVQDQITIAPGFVIVPEVAYFEILDAASGLSADETKTYHVGAKWQINF